jgi:hypothetical protein
MKKLKVIKKIIKEICWVCNGTKCKSCHNTGFWEESIFYHVVTDKKGQKICFDSDFIK